MGHKSGLKSVGAKGKVLPRQAKQLEAAFDGPEVDIKGLATQHVKASMDTLVRATRTKLTKKQTDRGEELAPWNVRTKAARDIIEIAGGRPETREPVRQEAGLTVVINKISTGERFEKFVKAVEDIEAKVVESFIED